MLGSLMMTIDSYIIFNILMVILYSSRGSMLDII